MSNYIFYVTTAEHVEDVFGITAQTLHMAIKQLKEEHPECKITDHHVYPL